jgi:hypothetical protein
MPCSITRRRTSGWASAWANRSSSRASTVCGVFAGAHMPYQDVTTKSGKPRFGYRRDIRQLRSALGGRHGQSAHLGRSNVDQRRGQVIELYVDLPAEHVGDRLCYRLVGHVQQVYAGRRLEVLHGQMG